jgi:NAD(P)-dependent dehydrogenase (short-subunit alcohol dehydrogenase family)
LNYAAHADAADRLATDGGRAISAMADVAETAAIDAVVARIEKELGPLTILVNNAGVSWRGTLDTYDPEQVARMRQINVEGVIHATRAVMGGMRQRRYGRIVNVSSIAAIGTALPGNAFYAATKAEVAILTRRFAMELGPHNITVNAVAPGFVRTDLTRGGRGAADWQGTEERFCCQRNDGPRWRTGGHRQCHSLLGFTRVGLDHRTNVDRGRRTNGLHRSWLVMSAFGGKADIGRVPLNVR